MKWRLVYTRHAQKDAKKIANSGLKTKVLALFEVLKTDPYQSPPPFEKLIGDLDGAYSRRINYQHRLVYQIINDDHIVKIIRMWTHYE